MKPAIIKLPDIYRGCLYAPIFFSWKDKNGNPFNLNGWVPLCSATDFSFNAQVVNLNTAQTRIVLSDDATRQLKLGQRSWDFIWVTGASIYPPVLSGVVTIREPLSNTTFIPVGDSAPDGPVT